MDNQCKGCQASVKVTDEDIKKIFNEKIKVKSVKLIDEQTYQNRLTICSECTDLQYGTTCRYCGCIVQIKAKIAGAACPSPVNAKW